MSFGITRVGLGTKLLACMSLFSLLAIVAAVTAWLGFQGITVTYRLLAEKSLPLLRTTKELSDRSIRLVLESPNLEAVTQPGEFNALSQRINQQREALETTLQLFTRRDNIALDTDTIKATTAAIANNVGAQLNLGKARIDTLSSAGVSRAQAQAAVNKAKLLVRLALADAAIAPEVSGYLLRDLTHLQFNVSNVENILEQLPQLSTTVGVTKIHNQFLLEIRQLVRNSRTLGSEQRATFATQLDILLALATHKNGLFDGYRRQLDLLQEIKQLADKNTNLTANLEQQVTEMVATVNEQADANSVAVTATVQRTQIVLIGIALLLVMAPLFLSAVWVYPKIVRRLEIVTQTTKRIADGDLEAVIDTSGSDELTDVSIALQQFRQDLLSKRHSEQILEEREERLRNIFDNMIVGLVTVAANGSIESFNPACVKLFGYSEPEAIGQNLTKLIPAFDLGLALRLGTQQQPAAHSEIQATLIGVPKRGYSFPIECSISSFQLGDRKLLSIFVQDITERQLHTQRMENLVENLSDSNTELERFAYVASHDLQEPLRMVTNFTQLLQQRYSEQLDATGLKFIKFANDGALRMQNLIDDLLEYSRLGHEAAAVQDVDLETTLNYVCESLQAAISESGGKIAHDALPTVRGNPLRLSQLMQNLVGNALKYRKPNIPPLIQISAVAQDQNWVVSVKDNGIGIKPEYQQKIFAAFERLHSRDQYSGTGIGLSICRRIVENMGGELWLESEPGVGSRFIFRIPQSPPATDNTPAPARQNRTRATITKQQPQ